MIKVLESLGLGVGGAGASMTVSGYLEMQPSIAVGLTLLAIGTFVFFVAVGRG